MNWLKRLLGSTPTRRITVDEPLVVESPRIGFLNLLGPVAQGILDEDKVAFRPLFAAVDESSATAPMCDVLMIYAHVEADGRIAGSSDGLRDIIRKSTAPIVVVASENDGKSYVAAGKQTGYGQANLVMTIKRRGATFTQFFVQLFSKMSGGKSMLLAWVELAPQAPGATQENCPECIFAAEISHIVFK
ncbi:MAG: hypothetical protein ACLPHP_11230 [Candidatus Sulfotelmatobacter sp.]